jgi:hypothetical protein
VTPQIYAYTLQNSCPKQYAILGTFNSVRYRRGRDSAVGIATRYGVDNRGVGVRVPVGSNIFLFSTSSRPVPGPTQPHIQWVPGALSPGVKRPEREADNSPPSSAEVKKTWIYTSTPTYAFMAWCLISQAQGQLYLSYLKVRATKVTLMSQHRAMRACWSGS